MLCHKLFFLKFRDFVNQSITKYYFEIMRNISTSIYAYSQCRYINNKMSIMSFLLAHHRIYHLIYNPTFHYIPEERNSQY